MKTTLLVVGRTVEQHYITAINDYIQRTKRYITIDMEVIPELKNTKSLSMEVQKEKEGELILKALQPGDVVVLLDEHGKEMRSLEFAEYMKRKMNTVNKRLVFIIMLLRLHVLKRPHIMGPVRQLDDDYADILRHREKHFPQVLRLHLHLVPIPGQPGQLGDAVHQKRHVLTKLLFDLIQGD